MVSSTKPSLGSSGRAGMTAACLPPPLYKVLPDVITQPIRVGKLLDEVFDGVLSEPEKVGTGDRVGVLAIADRVRLFDNR